MRAALFGLLWGCGESHPGQSGVVVETRSGSAGLPSFAADLNNVDEAEATAGGLDIQPMPYEQLSYRVDSRVPGVSPTAFDSEVDQAFEEWSRASGYRRLFYRVSEGRGAHIVIAAEPSAHASSCDAGYSQGAATIAHAFTWNTACLAGVIHLNSDLTWVVDGSNVKGTYDVRYAVLHEVGHLLGLEHVNEPGHVMYWEYVGVVRRLTDEEAEDLLAVIDH